MKALVLFLFLLTHQSFASNFEKLHGYVGYYEFPKPTFTKSSFDELIKKNNPQTVAQVVSLLPAELKKNIIVMFKSRSLQEASFKNPRILLFNEDGSLILTFNGHPSQAGYEALEILSFNFDTLKFELEERIFNQDLNARLKYDKFANDRTNRQGVNPPTCLACHRTEPRPNWGVYPLWPGALSQSEGGITRILPNNAENQEWVALKEFLKNIKNNPRYEKLNIKVSYWLKQIADVENKKSIYSNSVYGSYNQSELFQGNAILTSRIAMLNFMRLSHDIVCNPGYSANKKLIQLALAKQNSYTENVPLIANAVGATVEELNNYIKGIMLKQTQSDEMFINQMAELAGGMYTSNPSFGPNAHVALLNIVLNKKLNMDLSPYELSFERGNYNFSTPNSNINALQSILTHVEEKIGCLKR